MKVLSRAFGGIFLICGAVAAFAEDGVKVTGSLQQALSANLSNPIETRQNDKYDLSMSRSSLRLDMEAEKNGVVLVAKARVVREQDTPYLRRLEQLGASSYDGKTLTGVYKQSELREAYLDFKVGDRTQFKLGKQQVAWGESDFFQAMDVVNGFDYTWRSFLEPANEDLRKPVVMANMVIQFPEVDGALQTLYRPGWDRKQDIGNTYDLFGGRWANQPYKGFDFRNVTPYNFEHPSGNYKDGTGGFRWTGVAQGLNYSVAYLKTFNPDPVVSPANLFPGSNMTPFQTRTTKGQLGEIIYPMIDVYGLTASGYSPDADAVFSTELAYLKNYAYNFGYTNYVGLPGFNGVIQKDVVRTMVRMDKSLAFSQSILGAEKPAFFSLQLFDSWIRNFKVSEQIVNLVGQGQARKEHSTLLTGIFALSYANGTVAPEFVLGSDVTYGGGFFVPSVSWIPNNSWRFKAEVDLFWSNADRTPSNAATERSSALFGYFKHNDQLFVSATYQF